MDIHTNRKFSKESVSHPSRRSLLRKPRRFSSRFLALGVFSTTLLLPLALGLTGCGGGDGGNGTSNNDLTLPVTRSVESISASDSTQTPYGGTAVAGALPTNGTGPAMTVTSSTDLETVRGGSVIVNVQSATQLSSLLVGVAGVDSYYKIDLTGSRAVRRDQNGKTWLYDEKSHTSVLVSSVQELSLHRAASYEYSIVATFPTTIATTVSAMPLSVVAGYAGGGTSALSPSVAVNVRFNATAQASDKLQVTMAWSKDVDLDLHVTPPGGSELGYNNRSGQGGELDLDSNPACSLDHRRVENITWTTQQPPTGVYTVRPNYYENCESGAVSYTITVRNEGYVQRYIGTFAQSEANSNSGTDDAKKIYLCVVPPASTDTGLLSRLMLNEVQNPSASNYALADSTKGMMAIRALVENRKRKPSLFYASGTSTTAIITANSPSEQFAGFGGGISTSANTRALRVLTPPANTADYAAYWNALLSAVSGTVADPFAGVTTVGSQSVQGGTWGVRTAGSAAPGGSFVLLPGGAVAGQDFYTIKSGLIP